MYTITKEFSFSAAHALDGLPSEHQCARFHGHNYIVKVGLESIRLDSTGFVRDYGDLDTFKQWLDDKFDHRWLGFGQLGRVIGGGPEGITDEEGDKHTFILRQRTKPAVDFNPTAENLARYLFEFAATLYPEVISIGVSETPKTWAFYIREQKV